MLKTICNNYVNNTFILFVRDGFEVTKCEHYVIILFMRMNFSCNLELMWESTFSHFYGNTEIRIRIPYFTIVVLG